MLCSVLCLWHHLPVYEFTLFLAALLLHHWVDLGAPVLLPRLHPLSGELRGDLGLLPDASGFYIDKVT